MSEKENTALSAQEQRQGEQTCPNCAPLKDALVRLINAIETHQLCGIPEIKTVDDVIIGMRSVADKLRKVCETSGKKDAVAESVEAQGQIKCFTVIPSPDSRYDSYTRVADDSWGRACELIEESLERQFNEGKAWHEIAATVKCQTFTKGQLSEMSEE